MTTPKHDAAAFEKWHNQFIHIGHGIQCRPYCRMAFDAAAEHFVRKCVEIAEWHRCGTDRSGEEMREKMRALLDTKRSQG